VVKQGSAGVTAFEHAQPDGFAVPAFSVPVVDTTGAGDTFDAAFIAARMEGHRVGLRCVLPVRPRR